MSQQQLNNNNNSSSNNVESLLTPLQEILDSWYEESYESCSEKCLFVLKKRKQAMMLTAWTWAIGSRSDPVRRPRSAVRDNRKRFIWKTPDLAPWAFFRLTRSVHPDCIPGVPFSAGASRIASAYAVASCGSMFHNSSEKS